MKNLTFLIILSVAMFFTACGTQDNDVTPQSLIVNTDPYDLEGAEYIIKGTTNSVDSFSMLCSISFSDTIYTYEWDGLGSDNFELNVTGGTMLNFHLPNGGGISWELWRLNGTGVNYVLDQNDNYTQNQGSFGQFMLNY